MKIFKKISAIAASALMVGMTMGVAAAANYPSPFVSGGVADVAVVYGTGTGVSATDQVHASNIQDNLLESVASSGGSTITGGDSVLLAKSSDNMNLNNTWSVFSGTVTKDNLKTLLADGTYVAGDNDEFKYEQKIALGTPEYKHFRDSDYESLKGLPSNTPVLGFKLSSSTYVLNYTLDFTTDVSSDVTSSRMEDIEGSNIPLMGKNYYVSELQNGSTSTEFGKMILLDSANSGSVKEGETITVGTHEVSIDWIDNNEVVFLVDGVRAPASGKLVKGNSFKLSDGSYLGVTDISKLEVSGEVGSASFSIGTGKLELNHGSDIKMNDESVTGMKTYLYKSTGDKLDKIVLQWKTNDEIFLTPENEITMPGFGALKFTMNKMVRSEDEKITVQKDGDYSIKMRIPIKRGEAEVNLLYTNASGEFVAIGKDNNTRLLTAINSSIRFYEKVRGNDYHKYFFATYNVSKEGQSYLLKATVDPDATAGRNETTIKSYENGDWVTVCSEKATGDTCNIGDVSLTISTVNKFETSHTSGGDEYVEINASTGVNFNTVFTPGGLVVYLPYMPYNDGVYNDTGNYQAGNYSANESYTSGSAMIPGRFNSSVGSASNVERAGNNHDTWWLVFAGEDKDDTLAAGKTFNLTLDDSSNKAQVSQVNGAGNAGGAVYDAEEVGASSGLYEMYVRDDVATKVLHYTKSDYDDYAEIYYPAGNSESYVEVFLTESSATLVPSEVGEILVTDAEISSVSSKNLIVVGGSCINSAAATLVGGAYCGSAWTTATGVGTGQALIKSYSGKFAAGKIALLVAGYEATDTAAAATVLRTKTGLDTSKEYLVTTSTSVATEVTAA